MLWKDTWGCLQILSICVAVGQSELNIWRKKAENILNGSSLAQASFKPCIASVHLADPQISNIPKIISSHAVSLAYDFPPRLARFDFPSSNFSCVSGFHNSERV